MPLALNQDLHPGDLLERDQVGDWCYLDVRTPGEFSEAHIEGSINIPLADLGRELDSIRDHTSEKPWALVCRSGRRAREAANILNRKGLKETRVLGGGVVAWEEMGLPLVKGTKSMSLERQVRIAAGGLVLIGVALSLFLNPAFIALPGFVGAGLLFAGVSDTCGMGIMLGLMPWNRIRSGAWGAGK